MARLLLVHAAPIEARGLAASLRAERKIAALEDAVRRLNGG